MTITLKSVLVELTIEAENTEDAAALVAGLAPAICNQSQDLGTIIEWEIINVQELDIPWSYGEVRTA